MVAATAMPRASKRKDSRPSSLLRYAGGKRWAIPVVGGAIKSFLAGTGGRYVDPFLGGGSIPLWLGADRMLLGDLLEPLVEFWVVLRDQPGELAWQLSALAIQGVDKDTYYRIRDTDFESPVQRAAQFLYLNRLNYNGLVRYNQSGKPNVPYGTTRWGANPHRPSMINRRGRDAIDGGLWSNKNHILDASAAIQGAEILCGPWVDLAMTVGAGDVLYLDPPYHLTYNGYTGLGFDDSEQASLADFARMAADAGALVIAHNSSTPEVREWWSWATDLGCSESRKISRNAEDRTPVQCCLFTNRPELFQDW